MNQGGKLCLDAKCRSRTSIWLDEVHPTLLLHGLCPPHCSTKWGLWKPRDTLTLLVARVIGLLAPPALLQKHKKAEERRLRHAAIHRAPARLFAGTLLRKHPRHSNTPHLFYRGVFFFSTRLNGTVTLNSTSALRSASTDPRLI